MKGRKTIYPFFIGDKCMYILQLQLHAMESGHPSIERVCLFFLVVAITAPRNGKVKVQLSSFTSVLFIPPVSAVARRPSPYITLVGCLDVFSPTSTAVTAIVQDELPLDESSATAMGSSLSIVERTVQLKNKTTTSIGSISR